jgi:sugar phosphate isomerase/epimerase
MLEPRIYAHFWTLQPIMGVVEAARFSARERFSGLEIPCDPLDFWPGEIPASALEALAAIRDGEGLSCALYAQAEINPAARSAEERRANEDMVRRAIETAVALSSPVLCLHPGIVSELSLLERRDLPYETSRFDRAEIRQAGWARAVDAIAGWAGLAEQAGLTLVVENEVHTKYTAAPRAEDLADMIAAIGRPNVRVNFDTGHAFVGAGLREELSILEPDIAHVHLNDNATRRGDHLPLGEGAVDFHSIAPFLAGLNGILSLEIYAPDRPVEATLRSRDQLLDVIAQAGPGRAGIDS